MLMSEVITTVRSMMTGTLTDEISVLGAPYDPVTDDSITLKYPKKIGPGTLLTVGLNTFIVLEASTDGQVLVVLPSFDGGPNVPAATNDIVRIKPQFTDYSIFREFVSEIDTMSSPNSGLFATIMFESSTVNTRDGIYYIDPDDIPAGRSVLRLAKAEYQVSDTDAWQRFSQCEWQAAGNVVRVFDYSASATNFAFTLATTFGKPTDLSTDLAVTCGIPDEMADVPMLGVCSTLALGWEGRRTQPTAQGDPRRATEVAVSSNTSLSRQFKARQQERLSDEVARLIQQFPWRSSDATGPTTVFGYGGRR